VNRPFPFPCVAVLAVMLWAAPALARTPMFTVNGGVEFLHWTEDVQPIPVKEDGPLAVLALGWTQPGESPARVAYRGRVYIGEVDYHGTELFPPHDEVSSTSRYEGTTQEGQVLVGSSGPLRMIGGIGVEIWKRWLGAHQREDFTIGYLRVGAEASQPEPEGWTAGAGLRVPFSMSEDAHLDVIGFDQNPTLKPEAHVGLYADAGYRFPKGWSVRGTFEQFRFDASPPVELTVDGDPQGTIFQPGGKRRLAGISVGYAF